MDKQAENMKFIIQRYDTYIAGSNSKGNFLLAFSAFLAGGAIANYSKMNELVTNELGMLLLNIALVLLLLGSIITIVLIINAVYPYLNSANSSKDKYHSHIYFKSVAEFENNKTYHESLAELSDSAFEKDLAYQAFQLAVGLKSKYQNLKYAMWCIYFELFCMFSIITLIIIFK